MSETMRTPVETGATRGRSSDAPGEVLVSSRGKTTISDSCVAKISGLAAREVPGVHAMGGGTARALGAVRGMVGGRDGPTQGVSVDVGERQAAIDLDIVVDYGTSIPDLASAVRNNTISAVERMCGLEVTEVNIRVDDVHMQGEENQEKEEERPRVQ